MWTLLLRQAYEQGQPAFGLLIWPNRAEKLLILFRQSQLHWMLAVESAGTLPSMHTSAELPVTFDPTRWHTLRLQRQDDQLTIFLNGPEVLTILLPLRPEGIGLVTRDAAAAFTSVWQTAGGRQSLDELSRSKLQ